MKQFKLLAAHSRTLCILTITSLVIGIGCGKKSGNYEMKAADTMMAPSQAPAAITGNSAEHNISPQNAVSSSAAVVSKDSTKKFIRTADLRFKVKRAIEATYEIENIVSRHNGYVSFTNLESAIDNTSVVPVSEDSSLSTTYYILRNTMTLRVPDTQLDTTLKEIAPLIDFLDHRIIKAEDVSLQLLTNTMDAGRLGNSAKRLSSDIDKRGKKLDDITDAEDQ